MVPGSARNWIAVNAVQQPNLNKKQKMKTKKMTTLRLENSISRSPLRCGLRFISLALCCFALSPMAQAVSPPPDGGYPSDNTAEGDSALLNLTTGLDNTAIGSQALSNNT